MIENIWQIRWLAIWQRHLQVWRKQAGPSLMANFAEPLMTLMILGYGLGAFVGKIHDIPYITFLASGMICSSATNSATFECLYSAYTRMAIQQTWQGILATPLDIQDIVLGEIIWAATKSLFNVVALLIVAVVLGIVPTWQALWILPIMFLVGICFAAMALIFTALAHSYDFFLYYITLFITPLTLLSGVFFPLDSLPSAIQMTVLWFPLAHAIKLTRPLMIGQSMNWNEILLHLSVIIGYGVVATHIAIGLLRRRLND
jgi:lipooligosaccharide transport system permease protein